MKNKLTDHGFEGISALIRKEEEAALDYFRSRNFRDRVETRLKEKAGGRSPAVLFRRTAVPVLVVVLVMIMAGIFIFVLNHPEADRRLEFSALASALGRLPGFSRPPGWEGTAAPGRTGTSWLAESVRRTLVTAEQIKREEEQATSIPAGTPRVPRLSLDQKMKILFQEKTIERVLMLLKGDSKEV